MLVTDTVALAQFDGAVQPGRVDRDQVAVRVVVGRVEERARAGVPGQGRDGVDPRPLDVGDPADGDQGM